MKKHLSLLTVLALGLGSTLAPAQMGGLSGATALDPTFTKLFASNPQFTASIRTEIKPNPSDTIIMPGKIAFDSGKARFEMQMGDATGINLPAQVLDQMKIMGLDQMVAVMLPEQKLGYIIYPKMQTYVKNPLPADKTGTNGPAPIKVTAIDKEPMAGHPCIKNQVVVSDSQGVPQNFTVWNATDLNQFPVKIINANQAMGLTMTFTNISLTKPDAKLFALPAGFTAYDNMQTMMQAEMMKRINGGMAPPQ